ELGVGGSDDTVHALEVFPGLDAKALDPSVDEVEQLVVDLYAVFQGLQLQSDAVYVFFHFRELALKFLIHRRELLIHRCELLIHRRELLIHRRELLVHLREECPELVVFHSNSFAPEGTSESISLRGYSLHDRENSTPGRLAGSFWRL